MPYAFLAHYDNQVGIFVADTIKSAGELAWEGLGMLFSEPDSTLFSIQPMTQTMIDNWDGAPLSMFEDFEPWPGPTFKELLKEIEADDRIIAGYNRVMEAIPECEVHGHYCVTHALDWIEDQLNPPAGRPATKTELEVMTAICNLHDEVKDAREIIRALLGAPPPRIWKKWPKTYERAMRFLKPKPAQIRADGDE